MDERTPYPGFPSWALVSCFGGSFRGSSLKQEPRHLLFRCVPFLCSSDVKTHLSLHSSAHPARFLCLLLWLLLIVRYLVEMHTFDPVPSALSVQCPLIPTCILPRCPALECLWNKTVCKILISHLPVVHSPQNEKPVSLRYKLSKPSYSKLLTTVSKALKLPISPLLVHSPLVHWAPFCPFL